MSEVAIPNNIPTQLDANMARVAHFGPTGGRLGAWATPLPGRPRRRAGVAGTGASGDPNEASQASTSER